MLAKIALQVCDPCFGDYSALARLTFRVYDPDIQPNGILRERPHICSPTEAAPVPIPSVFKVIRGRPLHLKAASVSCFYWPASYIPL